MKKFSDNTKSISVLGSCGSVGTQALEVIDETGWRVRLLAGYSNITRLEEQFHKYKPEAIAVFDEKSAAELKIKLAGEKVRIFCGEDGICDAICEYKADITVHSISGMAGIAPAMAAAETGTRIAMANKEAVIAAGDLIYEKIKKYGGELIPVDSEHSAIFQCLCAVGAAKADSPADNRFIKKILLTASGGPFYGKTRDEMKDVTPEMALAHPTWRMGPKITIDCATLMNKGFEIIEAVRLFGVSVDQVEVLIHRQSIIHSMVEYIDNTVIAQLGLPDMRSAVRYALTYPDRISLDSNGVDFISLGSLTFDKPDYDSFPLLECARDAAKVCNTTKPAMLIAADEVAVKAFIDGRIGFNEISEAVCEVFSKVKSSIYKSVDDIKEADIYARETAEEIISKL